ncbi:MAG: hypothetical protein Q7J36_02040 [Thiobacillus sp.]|nr:hypothetical protein [Thiobacillus sp.]
MKRKAFTCIRMLIGMALISSFATTSYAQFNLDKLKSLAEQAKAYQEMANRPAQTANEDEGSKNNAGSSKGIESAAATPKLPSSADKVSVPGGLDVLGLKLGMTADGILTTLKQRGIRSNDVTVQRSELQYRKLGGASAPIPNSSYVSLIHARNAKWGGITIYFVPDGPQERAYTIYRMHGLPPDQRPTIDAYIKTLNDKFGPASLESSKNRHKGIYGPVGWMWWFFDANGRQIAAKNPGKRDCHVGGQSGGMSIEGQQNPGLIVSQCGSTTINARTTSGNTEIIGTLEITLTSFEDYADGMQRVTNTVNAFENAQTVKDSDVARKRRPEL